MKESKKAEELIPAQHFGGRMDVCEKLMTTNAAEATARFSKSSEKLLDVNNWGRLTGLSDFKLMDALGQPTLRSAREQDYIRIDIPGPGTKAGKGYDWVRIEEIKLVESTDEEILAMTVRPAAHPINKGDIPAHFLKRSATSTFIVRRKGLEISVEEHARNELINTNQKGLLDNVRNFVVGLTAKIGLSYPQWSVLVKAILEK